MPQNLRRKVTEELRSEIVDYLSRFCYGFSDPRLDELLGLSIGRVLIKESRLSRDWRSIATEGQLRHIVDWLKASIINDAAWLSNVDAHGRPKKLMKFGSIDQITQEADKAMLKAAQCLSGVKLVEGDEELYAELDDGYYVVRLLTPAALDRESAQMQHCIGHGSYDKNLKNKNILYLSLRDSAGKPHATMEICGYWVWQIRGKQNKIPLKRYLDKLIPFIKNNGLFVQISARDLGYVIDINNEWHSINDLPDELFVKWDLDLSHLDISRLPRRMTVAGNFYLYNTNITSLPEDLLVSGSLNLTKTKLTSLPAGLTVGGFLLLQSSNITSLPDDLMVGMGIYLDYSSIKCIPKTVSRSHSIHLAHTKITSLPDGLYIRGNLFLSKSSIISLPDDLVVGLGLDLSNTQIASLPKGLSVGTCLNLEYTNISSIPDDISVGGDLKLAGSKVTFLPEGLSVGGDLSLRGLKIENLPDVLTVGGDLDIRGTTITVIPEGVSVGKALLSDNPLLDLRPNIVRR